MMLDRREFMGSGLAAALIAGMARAETDPSSLIELMRDQAARVFAENRVETSIGMFHLPSAATYRSFFAWDSGWNAIALSKLDPESALQELKTLFSVQCDDGHVPHEVRVPELEETSLTRKAVIKMVSRQYDESGRSRFIDPPSFLIAAGVLHERTNDRRVFDLLPAMEKCVDYLLGERDLFGDGLVSIIHPWESGTDSAPVFDAPLGIDMHNPLAPFQYARSYPALLNFCADRGWDMKKLAAADRFVFEDVGMNALTAAGLASMSGLFEAAGDRDKSMRYMDRAKAMVEAMEKVLWDDEEGFFYPRYDLTNPASSRRRCLTGLAPLITGLVDQDKATRVIEGALLSPKHFNGPWLVPFNSISELEKRIPFENMMLWRGHCIWISMNWVAARAAARCGRADYAQKITRATASMIASQGFREFYDSRTGKGGGAPDFTWPALVLDMIEDYGL